MDFHISIPEIIAFCVGAALAGILAVSIYRRRRSMANGNILGQTDKFRNVFAYVVFGSAAAGIAVIIVFFVGVDTGKTQYHEAFTATLPVFTTWVGTILAFYFSRENFEAASRASGGTGSAVATPRQIDFYMKNNRWAAVPKYDMTGKTAAAVSLSDIYAKIDGKFDVIAFVEKANGGESLKFLLPKAALMQFIFENASKTPMSDTLDTLLKFVISQKI